VRCTDPSVLLI